METKQNTGALFANKRKEKETQPDYTGKVNVNGKDMDLSAWVKQDKNGNNYLSLSFKEPYVKPSNPTKTEHSQDFPF